MCAVLGLGATSCSDPGSEPSVSSANRTSTPVYASATDTRTGASGPASSSPEPRVTGPTADTAGPAYPMTEADQIVDGIDWRMPDWVRPAQISGFFSESASPADKVYVRGLDQSWRQIGDTDFVVEATTDADAIARLVRVIRLAPPTS